MLKNQGFMETVSINSAAAVLGLGLLNVNKMRPYVDPHGRSCIAVNGRAIHVNAPALLQYDEWKDIDRRVIETTTQRLVAVADLMSRGLVHPLGSIGNTVSIFERQSDIEGAQVDMSGITRGKEDTPNYDYVSVPVPIVHKDFRVNIRRLEASRKFGEGIDVTSADLAARHVAEKTEDMLFSGIPIQVDGGTIYGYLNHPDRNFVDNTGNNWSESGTTGAQIVAQVASGIALMRADGYHGPYMLYISASAQGKLDEDYSPGTSDNRTIRQRLMQLDGMAGIQVADRLASDNQVLVQLTSDVVDMAIAQETSTVQWNTQGGMVEHFKVMFVGVPRVKSDFDGHSGVCHIYDVTP